MTTMTLPELAAISPAAELRSLALDLTRSCQAKCDHCYNSSGPSGTSGEMGRADWVSVLDQAAAMGVRQIQFIGGEPTMHPDLPELVNHALDHGLVVEVFSNLIHVTTRMWQVFRQRGVILATSYYSDSATEHEAITRNRGSYGRTKMNIRKAIRFHIPVRAALVDVVHGQRIEQATAELRDLGVTNIRVDRLRGIGRGAGETDAHDITELCGRCTRGRAAVLPNGSVAGCVMSGGMMSAGNVLTTPLASIIGNETWQQFAALVPEQPDARGGCVPDEDSCQPSPGTGTDAWDDVWSTACNPDSDGNDCAPAETEACGPKH